MPPDNPDHAFKLFADDYTPPKNVRFTVKLRPGNLDNAKGPDLKGFVAVDQEAAQALLDHIKSLPGEKVVFLDVAVWQPRNDPDWHYTGGIELRKYDPSQRKQKESADAGETNWY